jgi:hypothetical protein
MKLVPLGIVGWFSKRLAEEIRSYIADNSIPVKNTLSVFENAMEYHFLYVDYFLKNRKPFIGRNDIDEAENNIEFDKMILCPLMIDFGYKNLQRGDYFYNLPPRKPIVNQVVDLLNAIYYYYNKDITEHPAKGKNNRLKIVDNKQSKNEKLFEIYPFLGLNTRNYDLEELEAMFSKYFSGYEDDNADSRHQKLFDKMGTVKVDLENLQDSSVDFTYIFAGIKLYPPLGFDPWPADNNKELEKVIFLYNKCIEYRLPVTVHCSDKGFVADENAKTYTNPAENWSYVINNPEFKDLKINFAHMGKEFSGKTNWQDSIFKYITSNKNIYTDFSARGYSNKFYETLNADVNTDLKSNILFGSDFMINLLHIESYNEYLELFINTPAINNEMKKLFASGNAYQFLFG